MSIKIIDNFLDKNSFLQIKNFLTSQNFQWNLSEILNEEDAKLSGLSKKNNYQLFHLFYHAYAPQSNHITLINPIILKINPTAIVRIKANLGMATEKIIEHGYHIDYKNIKTGIYYVNSNNGYTSFEDGTKIESIENRFVEFDSNLRHTGTSTTDQPFRIVINFNYIVNDII